ncbi:MAG: polysaccharide pyruvyl transferase family protein, partial [Rikenellaceae bacterium]
AQELATNMECELIDICAGRYSVEDFVSLFKYAQYVVTSSFHGTAFSVIFNRPLYSVTLDDGHDERCRNLLTSIGAEGMLTPLDSFDPTPQSVDYTTINQKVAELRNESVEYLKGI